MEWSQKRRILYALGFACVIILAAAYPVYLVVHKAPTCFDTKQNGTETGVDCGGTCALLCKGEAKPPHVVWAKAFPIGSEAYDLAAYVENVNTNAGLRSVRYTISVFDTDEKLLTKKNGVTEFAPASGILLFETGVSFSGNPERTEVSFNENDLTKWTRATTAQSSVVSKNQILKNVDSAPRFDAVLVNTDQVNEVPNLTLGAIVYDALRHPIAVSKTYVKLIPKRGEQDIFFTWPLRFTKHSRGGICTSPADTMLVFDRSGSMNIGGKNPPEPLTTAKNAAKIYVDLADLFDKVGLVSFAGTASNPIDHELSSDLDSVKTALSAIMIKKDGIQNTNLGDAIKAAATELESARHTAGAKQAIVVLTDGDTTRPLDPTNSRNTKYPEDYAIKIAADARKRGLDIYAIGLGKNINEAFLKENIVGDLSHYYSAPTASNLLAIYKTISEKVCPPENFITEIVITPSAIFAE